MNKKRGSTIPPECLEMSSNKLALRIHLEEVVSDRVDLEDFQASRASMTNLDRVVDKVKQGNKILLVTYLKSSRSSSVDSKDRGEAEEPKHK